MSIFAVFFFVLPIIGVAEGDWNSHDHSTYWFFLASWAMCWLCSAVLRKYQKDEEKK